ncbi:MAG: DNA mismatch repair protein MutS [Alphaproteobacteria bacterium]|nr:DNA mismatch repair protein MutS [Alphaproteobacteria bacterium]MBN2779631.1 DNA mismatch repair protein MutS [Alphaproteobacteria bacterium]
MTPMMQQYFSIKADYPDTLLFYRMGDFYEMFFDDAVTASRVLEIALTHRGKDSDDNPIPMAGVPYHSYEPYLQKLIKAGFRVGIAEQMENPEDAKKRGYKSVVKREVTRVVTPGTLSEENLLDHADHNFLMACFRDQSKTIFSWADLSTGHFFCETSSDSIADILDRVQPREVLISEEDSSFTALQKHFSGLCFTPLPRSRFLSSSLIDRLKSAFIITDTHSFGEFSDTELKLAGLIADYILLTAKAPTLSFQKLTRITPDAHLLIDGTTRRSLELTQSQTGDKNTTLFHVINRTQTAGGKRLLKRFFDSPLTDITTLNQRLDLVQFFAENDTLSQTLKKVFCTLPDLERILSRVILDRANPRDLGQIKSVLAVLPKLSNLLKGSVFDFSGLSEQLGTLYSTLMKALKEELPFLARQGHFIQDGYHPPLDQFRMLAENGASIIDQLKHKYAQASGVSNLKIKHNNVIGYYIEVSAKNADYFLNPTHGFIHRQTMAGAVRFTTQELTDTEYKLKGAQDKALGLEVQLFEQLCDTVKKSLSALHDLAERLSETDVFSALARLALEHNYTRPVLTTGLAFEIKDGRHPVVEAFIDTGTFIANDCVLENKDRDTTRLWLITGPNMAGKSTFLRQNALIAFMAQIGSFVPATSATLGIVDKIFSRVGASDNLSKGQSTFMTEMIETATILNQATPKSLVILDEIGRGTATFDGLSLAWAVVEYLHNTNQSRGLFATHYHELTTLSDDLASLSCHTSTVREWKGEIVFMHKISPGTADKSYGIHVAKLAGLPTSVLSRAKKVLSGLESQDRGHPLDLQNDLFARAAVEEHISIDPRLEKLAEIDPDALSPKEALEVLYDLKK